MHKIMAMLGQVKTIANFKSGLKRLRISWRESGIPRWYRSNC